MSRRFRTIGPWSVCHLFRGVFQRPQRGESSTTSQVHNFLADVFVPSGMGIMTNSALPMNPRQPRERSICPGAAQISSTTPDS